MYVYLIMQVDNQGNELFKIGITKKEISDRLSTLQTGNPNKLSILKFYESTNYKQIERLLHKKYYSNRTEAINEWFSISNEAVMSLIDDCKKLDETLNYIKENNSLYS